ncbi:MAG: hypothetical protein IIB62_04360, partial [Proteobacteria bacterium]|nr:hypothetical protein [Pseudomonadota bacterium]
MMMALISAAVAPINVITTAALIILSFGSITSVARNKTSTANIIKRMMRSAILAALNSGMASAMILRDAFSYFPPVEFVHYDTPEHRNMEVTEGVIFCDFSPHPDLAAQFLEAGAIVLDHHKTVKPIVSQFVKAGQGVFGDEELEPGVCGATLAYQHVWRSHPLGEQHPNVA